MVQLSKYFLQTQITALSYKKTSPIQLITLSASSLKGFCLTATNTILVLSTALGPTFDFLKDFWWVKVLGARAKIEKSSATYFFFGIQSVD